MDLEYFEHFLIKSDIIYIDRRLTLRKNDRETIMYSNFHKKSSLSIIIRLIFIKVYCVCVCVWIALYVWTFKAILADVSCIYSSHILQHFSGLHPTIGGSILHFILQCKILNRVTQERAQF